MHSRKISVVGLGYVGLQVAVEFGKLSKTYAFDINQKRLKELSEGYDRTKEVSPSDLQNSDLFFTNNISDLRNANFHIVAVPTPVNDEKKPDLTLLKLASKSIGKIIKEGDIVVFESTVYPGVTEEVCLPILEDLSGLKSKEDFWVGYSPERINPSDKEHVFSNIKKIVSGQDKYSLEIIAEVYESAIHAGVFKADNILTAEAAKVIENTQRDINIALMNELSIIFHKMNIETKSVLEAAMTKWNFLDFKPGLVGGHCIGIDPYYLTHKSQQLGYEPKVVLSGREVNDSMSKYIAEQVKSNLQSRKIENHKSLVTILGATFKEDCTDIRNSKIFDIIKYLNDFGIETQLYDPLANQEEVESEYKVKMVSFDKIKPADVLILGVCHKEFLSFNSDVFKKLLKDNSFIIDVSAKLESSQLPSNVKEVWRL
jgi:UDP-N-acetyl-D-glucosamine/UDP-N-acetyl-D-galactosamine dehydrogenase